MLARGSGIAFKIPPPSLPQCTALADNRFVLFPPPSPSALFFTGDTCQTIARGVGFRFEDLTTMFYQLGAAQRAALQARGQRVEDLPRGAVVAVPEVSKLTVNYRTHNGILGAASQLVSLLLPSHYQILRKLVCNVGNHPCP